MRIGKLSSQEQLDDARVLGHNALSVMERKAQLAIEDSSLALAPAAAEIASGSNRLTIKRSGDVNASFKGELKVKGKRILLG